MSRKRGIMTHNVWSHTDQRGETVKKAPYRGVQKEEKGGERLSRRGKMYWKKRKVKMKSKLSQRRDCNADTPHQPNPTQPPHNPTTTLPQPSVWRVGLSPAKGYETEVQPSPPVVRLLQSLLGTADHVVQKGQEESGNFDIRKKQHG